MTKAKITMAAAMFSTCLITTGTYAAPVTLNDSQMDVVAAGGVEKVDGFVCPVISTDAVLNSAKGIVINGAYSVLGPDVSVPVHATNGDGAGSPGGPFSRPGDTDYTAIWAK